MILKNLGYMAAVAVAAIGLVLGAAGSSEAKGKKKPAAKAAPPAIFCLGRAPVCATRGNMKFTYANACFATKDGAKVTSDKACPAPKAAKAKKGKKKVAKKSSKKPAKK
ncbi:MAG: hypothetical protein Q8M26_09280 [Pseudolabrys sp.]|nr:hypothetical protein [Pseudolabrys sp.]